MPKFGQIEEIKHLEGTSYNSLCKTDISSTIVTLKTILLALFIRDTIIEGQCLRNILQLYGNATGIKINENKFAVYPVRLEDIQDLGIGGCFPFQHLKTSKGVKIYRLYS